MSQVEPKEKRTRRPKARHWSLVMAAMVENSAAMCIVIDNIGMDGKPVIDHASMVKALRERAELLSDELTRSMGKEEEES